ncbi:sensor histidine kinase [Marinomonas rhizomae]|uniref:sensor histidine kinase n=1 Tax=Marinomonas rhizomae TaxID=491948 RepID=UPI0021025E5D|nr:HAMP domain-containing sensor histidine kinase [Marinomonas rhizomae]UTV99473.1 sensor histidine kinase [Marinomonas rhizomae]
MIFGKGMSQKSLLCMYLSGILIIIALLSWGSYRFFLDNKISELAWNESEVLSRGTSVFSREMGHIKRVTLLLRNSINARLSVQNAAVQNSVPVQDLSSPQREKTIPADWEAQVVDEFTQFARTSKLISQVRWIMPNGQEHIRINSQAGIVTRVPEDQLQNKADRHYVKNAPDSIQDVYVSSLDLNIENKEIVRPFQPTVRGVVRVKGDIPGILVVNYDLSKLFELARTFSSDGVYLEILDLNGNWVLAADKNLEWGGILYPDNLSFNIKTHFPAIWQEMDNVDGLERIFDDGRLWSLLKLYIDEEADVQSSQTPSLYFIARSNSDVFSAWRMRLILSIIGGAVALYALIAWLVWRQVTAQFETYRLLQLVQQEKAQAEQANRKLSLTNKRLVDLQDELVETSKLSSLGLMVAGLAHEMHTPLGGVRMALSSCKVWLDKEAKQQPSEGLEKLDASLLIAEKNLVRALDVVTSFKRIVSDRTAQDTQNFFFHNVVNDILFTYKPVLKKRSDLHIESECPEDIDMSGYPGVMSQIIQNLLDNALDHAFQRLDKGVITLVAKKEQDNLVLVIKDNGRGISSEIKARIFEPFVTTGRTNQHTGLGLHLVSQWVNNLMKGRIDVVSEVGVGTTFTLTIPLQLQKSEEAESEKL